SVDLDRPASDRTRNGELASGAAGSPPGGGYLQNLAGRLGSFGVEADAVVRRSDRVADAVDEAAQEAGADLLVLGARGAGGASARYGRCARRLLLHGETHLLVVRDVEHRTTVVGEKAAPRSRRPGRRFTGERARRDSRGEAGRSPRAGTRDANSEGS
ncbi:MAG: universal stress protein, partial [Gemmatimonadota bacterium]